MHISPLTSSVQQLSSYVIMPEGELNNPRKQQTVIIDKQKKEKVALINIISADVWCLCSLSVLFYFYLNYKWCAVLARSLSEKTSNLKGLPSWKKKKKKKYWSFCLVLSQGLPVWLTEKSQNECEQRNKCTMYTVILIYIISIYFLFSHQI